MQKIKAIMFDIDDTLYSHRTKEIPKQTYLALDKLKKKGYPMAICTSRMISELSYFPEKLFEFFDYVFTGTGTIIHSKGKLLESVTMPMGVITQFKDYFKENNIEYGWADQEGNHYYGVEPTEEVKNHVHRYTGKYPLIKEWTDEKVSMLTFRTANEIKFKEIHQINKFVNITSWNTSGQISTIGIDKAYGLHRFAQFLNISTKDIAAFGDGSNDISMIDCSGLGIAVGNSHMELQRHAQYVTTAIEDGGIYVACKHLNLID